MSAIIDGSAGITTPGVVNTAGETIATTLVVTGVTTLTGGLNAALPVLSGGTGVTTSTGSGANVLGTGPSISSAVMTTMASSVITSATAKSTATCSFTGVIAGTALTASAITGTITVGQLITGTGVTAGTTIISGSGTAWVVSVSQTVASTAITVVGIDFTGIPSWVKRITVMLSGVSTNGATNLRIQLGDIGGVRNTGYLGSSCVIAISVATINFTVGFDINDANGAATTVRQGDFVLNLLDSATNTWTCFGAAGQSDAARVIVLGGTKSLPATLDRVRLTTVNGTDTFDAGSVNILYE